MTRHDWTVAEIEGLFALPFLDLLLERAARASAAFRAQHGADEHAAVDQDRRLPEDCAYCPQSVRYDTGLSREALMEVAAVKDSAERAKAAGATRFCMGAA